MNLTTRRSHGALRGLAFLAAIGLSACGGGGGSDSTPPPPAGTLDVSASAATVPAGGKSVTITAVTANVNGTVSWSLTGPGSLSASSGNQIIYVPPLPSQLPATTDATLTATLGSLQKTVKLAISSAPGGAWEIAQPPVGDWRSVRYLDGRFYLIERDAMLSSSDGAQWTPILLPQDSSVNDIGLGAQGFVAVGDAGNVLHSLDGMTWTQGTVSAAPGANGLDPRFLQTSTVTYGNGVYVASGVQGVMSSTDGIHWLSSTAGVAKGGVDIYFLAFGDGHFFASGYPQNYTSTDGVQWTAPFSLAAADGVAFGNGMFVAADNQLVHTSPDGLTWSNAGTVADTNSSNWNNPRVSYSNGQFYAYGDLGVDVSADGLSWSRLFALPANNVNTLITSVAASATDTIVVGFAGLLQHSSDGVHWASPALGVDADLAAVDCMNGTCVALTTNGGVLTSGDTAHWSVVSVPGNPVLASIAHGNGLFVAAGSGTLYSSADGQTWTSSPITPTTYLYGAAYGNGRFVVVGFLDTVLTSSDGANWTATGSGITPVGNAPGLHCITYGNGRFVAIDNAGGIYSSPDGSQWTAGPAGAPNSAVTYGDSAGFVAVGSAGSVWRSKDGITWSPGSAGTASDLATITYGDSQYVASGAAGTVLLSEDAIHWSARPVGLNSLFLGSAFNGQEFVVVGSSGVVVTSSK